MHWVHRTGAEEAQPTVVIACRAFDLPGLELGVRFQQTPVETVVQSAVFFNAGTYADIQPFEERNRKCTDAINRIMGGVQARSWLNEALRDMNQALGRLVNETLAERRFTKGGAK